MPVGVSFGARPAHGTIRPAAPGLRRCGPGGGPVQPLSAGGPGIRGGVFAGGRPGPVPGGGSRGSPAFGGGAALRARAQQLQQRAQLPAPAQAGRGLRRLAGCSQRRAGRELRRSDPPGGGGM